MELDIWLIAQCVLGAVCGLWLHFLKKAKEHDVAHGTKVSTWAYITSDPKEAGISVLLALILIIGLPELTEIAQQLAWQVFGLRLPALQRSFFLCAILGGFGNSLSDIVAAYFGGTRLARFLQKS